MRVLLFMVSLALVACGGASSPQSRAGSPPPIGVLITVEVTLRSEIEPNNNLAAADAHTMPTHGPNADYVGFGVVGTVNDTGDPADYFVFTASRAHVFTIQLCQPWIISNATATNSSCTPFDSSDAIDTSVAYFEILDQDGVLLLSSQGDTAAGNFQEISIDAGVAYYLAVFAEDTGGAAQGYQIETTEKVPLP